MIDPNSHKVKGYMEDYKNKIKAKFLSNKETKKALLETLSEEEHTSDKEREINERYTADMKNFVNELKSDKKFAAYQEKYHEDIQEIRKLLRDVAQVNTTKGPEYIKEFITKTFPEAKKIAFEGKSMKWNAFVKKFGVEMIKLKKANKQQIFGSLSEIFENKEKMISAFKEVISGFKAIDINDKFISTFMMLICIVGTIDYFTADRIIMQMIGALRVVQGSTWMHENFKEVFIKNASTNEVKEILQSHKFDYHNDLPLETTTSK